MIDNAQVETSPIRTIETTLIWSVCPHCNRELKKVIFKEAETTLGSRYLYFCSHCEKSLGVTQQEGEWVG